MTVASDRANNAFRVQRVTGACEEAAEPGAGGSLSRCAGLLLTFISAGKRNSSGLERLRGCGSHLLFRTCFEFK